MPTVDIYSKQQVDALIAGAGGLPDPTSASAGDVLTLDSNKAPAWSAIPDELPATTGASAGDVLTLDSNKDPAWVTPSGGGGSYDSCSTLTELYNVINGMSQNQVIDLFMYYANDQTCTFRGMKYGSGASLKGDGLNCMYVSSNLDMRTVYQFDINSYGAITMTTRTNGTATTTGNITGMTSVSKILYKIIG